MLTPKNRRIVTGPLLPIAILVFTFLLSLFFNFIPGSRVDGRVFFFPENKGGRIGSERRGIPERKSIEDQIDFFLDELFLGPETLALSHTVPRGTKVFNVSVVDRTAYVNLSLRLLDTEKELPISLEEGLANIRYNILFNFSRVEEVVFTIAGHQVYSPYYPGSESAE